MQTETYLIDECLELIEDPEKLDDWHRLVKEMDLEGQKSVASGECSPVPFERMNEADDIIFSKVFPRKVDLHTFNDCAIPLTVLSVVALCEKEKYFETIEVWTNPTDDDPVVVGRRKMKGKYGEVTAKYLLARFGNALLPFEAIKEKAREILVKERKARLNKARVKLEGLIGSCEVDVDLAVTTGDNPESYIYI